MPLIYIINATATDVEWQEIPLGAVGAYHPDNLAWTPDGRPGVYVDGDGVMVEGDLIYDGGMPKDELVRLLSQSFGSDFLRRGVNAERPPNPTPAGTNPAER